MWDVSPCGGRAPQNDTSVKTSVSRLMKDGSYILEKWCPDRGQVTGCYGVVMVLASLLQHVVRFHCVSECRNDRRGGWSSPK